MDPRHTLKELVKEMVASDLEECHRGGGPGTAMVTLLHGLMNHDGNQIKFLLPGHRGMVGSAIHRTSCQSGFTNLLCKTSTD